MARPVIQSFRQEITGFIEVNPEAGKFHIAASPQLDTSIILTMLAEWVDQLIRGSPFWMV